MALRKLPAMEARPSATAQPDEDEPRLAEEKLPVMFAAPGNMRSADKSDPIFDPVVVSIGPFHHDMFRAMEGHKERIFKAMESRFSANTVDWDGVMKDMLIHHGFTCEQDEDRHRYTYHELIREIISRCYSQLNSTFGYGRLEMVWDACFILEIFRMHTGLCTNDGADLIFTGRWMLPALALDMVKLENQLPYSVLKKFYKITKMAEEPSLNQLAGKFLALLCPGLDTLEIEDGRSHDHLLAMFHSTFISTTNDHRVSIDAQGNCNSFPCATDLRLSGIKVVKKEPATTTRWNLLDISYNNGTLEIPTLLVDHRTQTLMRNLVAYEQCDKQVPAIFTSYVTFMDALVNSAEDVEVLRVAGVINHFMNSNDEVNKLLNNLTANIKFDMNEGYLAGLNAQVYRDHHSRWPQLKARFKRLVNSREGIAYIVTIVALYLTILQTVFTVLSYVQPKS